MGATSHDCGWALPVKVHESPLVITHGKREPPSPAAAQAMEKLRAMLEKTARARRLVEAAREEHGFREVTAGHGSRCMCEHCFAIRTGRPPAQEVASG